MAHYSPAEMADAIGKHLLAFPITHYDQNLKFDEASFRDHLAWMVEHRPAGVFAAGGTGEFFALTPAEVATITKVTVAEVNGKTPVLTSVGYGNGIAAEMAAAAESTGADGILLLPPYLVNASQEGLREHVEAVCRSTSLGVIVYNRDNAILNADSVAKLCDSCPNLVGFKDGVGDLELITRIWQKVGDRLVYVGGLPTAETFALPYLTMGVTTYSSAIFNFLPKFALSFYDAVRRSETATINSGLQRFVLPYTAIRDRGRGYAVSIVKAGVAAIGRGNDLIRPPLTRLDAKSMDDLKELISAIGDGALEQRVAAE
jgi:5-dehydro-4-deoxyglucarate dehydratase